MRSNVNMEKHLETLKSEMVSVVYQEKSHYVQIFHLIFEILMWE
jgi:restriction endonuclease